MARHIETVACSAESAGLCHRSICQEVALSLEEHFHPEVNHAI